VEEPTALILMLKNAETGMIEGELAEITLEEDILPIERIWAEKSPDGTVSIHLRLIASLAGKDFTDEEYEDILDCYETDVFDELAEVSEAEGFPDPAWDLVFALGEGESDASAIEGKLDKILAKHKQELDGVYEILELTW
jgi:hypothetical protein